ncbi:MAG: TonB-dependent receptor [Muribaculaceae bacterium]|nr:TonB-dependent receptor [Muribaculaceae bacterium]
MKNICFQMSRKAWLAIVMALCLSFPALAQKITVTGTVTDPAGEPLIGASVLAQGTSTGTATDVDGNYRIDVDSNGVLTVSYVGYDTKTIKVEGRTVINVTLSENSVVLNEVVAIGYGTVKKSDATGAVATVKPSEVQAGLATSAQDLLVGRSPGVTVTTTGSPSGGADIIIRGGASLSASNAPLIVIDGVPMDTKGLTGSANPLALVSPENVESMTILKDASATAIYGSRASNGVIIITTKKGQAGKPQVNFTANLYVTTPRKYVDMMGADEYRNFITSEYGEGSAQHAALGTANTDWQKEILRTSVSHDYSLSVGGTAGILPYRVSVAYTGNNGIVETTKMDRITGSINLSPKFFNNLLSVNANVKGAYVNNRFYDDNPLGTAIGFNPTLPVYAPDGNVFNNYTTYVGSNPAIPSDPGSGINALASLNPVSLINENNHTSDVYQSIGNIQFDLVMPFLKDLRANLNLGYDVSEGTEKIVTAANSPKAWKQGNSILNAAGDVETLKDGAETTEKKHQYKYNLLLDFYMNYKKNFDVIKSGIDVTGGYSWQKFHSDGYNFTMTTSGPNAGTQAIETKYYSNPYQLVSFFGRLNYTFMERYLVTATVRHDGTSRFSKDHRWGTFPSVALAWKLHEEAFMEGTRGFLSDLKIRGGWGVTGQQDIGDDLFPYLPIYSVGTNPQYTYPSVIGGNGTTVPVLPNKYNSEIKWEETTTWNAGIDFGFLNNRITGSVDFYKRETKDLLTWATYAAGSNLSNAGNMNIGDLENTGIEFTLSTRPIVTKDLTWTSDFNVAWNKNKITRLAEGGDFETGGISFGTGNTIQKHEVGHPAYSFYVFQQVYDAEGNPIEGEFVDRNGDGQITKDDKYLCHSKDPKVTMTWSNTVNWKNWDFGIVLRANLGNYVYNDVQASNCSKSANSSTPLSNLMSGTFLFEDLGDQGAHSDYFVQNASFLRCDNITLGYTWSNLLNDNLRLRLYGAVQNPFVITNYKGLDPEVFSGIDRDVYPKPITFSLGVVAQF